MTDQTAESARIPAQSPATDPKAQGPIVRHVADTSAPRTSRARIGRLYSSATRPIRAPLPTA
jgi:hypothetical protein